MSTVHALQKLYGLPDKPEEFGGALAHVVIIEGRQDVLLGQAWLAGPNKLVTAGHIVEQFARTPAALFVKFPASGNRYQVRSVKLHPSFVRQPDQLVKFDVAVLMLELISPEKDTAPLPIVFEKAIKTHQPLSAIRYPTHLGQLTATPNPLAQLGRMLGPLRKHDAFHLLHDLALAPGDSGAPIFDGSTVVAIHCGDTATLPGLNLPTTAIRLMLWIDALRELGIAETFTASERKFKTSVFSAVTTFLVAALLSFVIVTIAMVVPGHKQLVTRQPVILPLNLSFNKPIHGYKYGDEFKIVFTPRSDSYLYVFDVDSSDNVIMIYPPYGECPSYVNSGQSRMVDRFGAQLLRVNNVKDKLHIVSLISPDSLLMDRDFKKEDPANSPMVIKGTDLIKRIGGLERKNPANVLHLVMDGPAAEVPEGK